MKDYVTYPKTLRDHAKTSGLHLSAIAFKGFSYVGALTNEEVAVFLKAFEDVMAMQKGRKSESERSKAMAAKKKEAAQAGK